jgi:cytochrome c oxidase assembly protein subunit 15
MRRFSLLVATSTLALVMAGALVTSNDAALAVPDWPLNWGRLVPPLEGGIRFEFAHRVLALLVAILTTCLAVGMQQSETHPWMRRLGWWTVATVIAQALLGGAMVKLVDPKVLAVTHASLAEICFGLTVAIAAGYYGGSGAGNTVAKLTVAAIFIQAVLGAAVRHHALGVAWHIGGAIVATGVAMWAGLAAIARHLDDGKMPRSAIALLGITALQFFSGLGAYSAVAAAVDDPQPMPLTVWATVAHVALGALVFATAIVFAMKADKNAAN